MALNLDEATRGYIYRIATAVQPLLIAYGVFNESTAGLWLGLLAAVLALGTNGLASVNTSTKRY